MKRWIAGVSLFCMMGAVSFALAESPFVGTWKLNQAKSHQTGDTMKFSSAGNGMMRETIAEGSFTFKTDGQSYPSLFGDTENWQKLSGHSWKVMIHAHGGYTYARTLNISDDGKKLTTVEEGTNPDGSSFRDTVDYTRMGSGNGLMGTWKSTAVKSSDPGELVFEAKGDNGITWKLPQIKAMVDVDFNGKDITPEGPTVPPGLTLMFTKVSSRSFRMAEKMNGKPIYKARYTVSADGKMLREVGMPVGQAQPETRVYEKQ